jgi:dihydrofolate reductase
VRKVVAFTLMSIDGGVDNPKMYFQPSESPDEPFVWDEETDAFESFTTSTQDTVLLGRNLWEEWQDFWPAVSSPFADFINGVTKYVLTSRPLVEEWPGSHAVAGPVDRVVADLKAQEGKDIGVHGSIQLVQSLLEADLLDELRIVVGPVAGTPGRRLFDGMSVPRRYRLTSAASTPMGNLLLTYDTRPPVA